MGRTPITCPKCQAIVEPEVPFKTRRGGSAPAEPKVVAPPVAQIKAIDPDAEDLVVLGDEDEALDPEAEAAEDDENALIEDASDLGEDDDDMAEVMEHLDEEIGDEV